jgi:hypothetical protein
LNADVSDERRAVPVTMDEWSADPGFLVGVDPMRAEALLAGASGFGAPAS